MTRYLYILALAATAAVASADDSCDGGQCTGAPAAYVDSQVASMSESTDAGVELLQQSATRVAQKPQKCRRRCRYHPKLDCRLICRVSCVKGKPVKNPICKDRQTTTTTTTSREYTNKDPPSDDQTCDYASTLKTNFNTLKENTLGADVPNPRLYFKDVVVLSKMLKDKEEWQDRKFDLIVEDASQKPRYVKNPEKNIVSAIYEESGLTKYVKDKRNYTGTYLGTVRIGIDSPGSYVFRFTVVDSETGEPAKLPLFPFTFYDVDGEGEIVSTCDAVKVISVNSKLEEKGENGCYIHHAQGREVNLPTDFEDLTKTQASQSVTYVYANKPSWDIQLHLEPSTPQRYFIMKSSNVLACSGKFDVAEGNKHQWKNTGVPKKADA